MERSRLMAWLCSNEKCSDTGKRPQGTNCPSCGSVVQEYRYTRLYSHLSIKSKNRKSIAGEKKAEKELEPSSESRTLVSAEMTDQELEEAIHRDLRTPIPHRRLSELIDLIKSDGDDSDDALIMTALMNQGKIIIRQNELILRVLKRTLNNPIAKVEASSKPDSESTEGDKMPERQLQQLPPST